MRLTGPERLQENFSVLRLMAFLIVPADGSLSHPSEVTVDWASKMLSTGSPLARGGFTGESVDCVLVNGRGVICRQLCEWSQVTYLKILISK